MQGLFSYPLPVPLHTIYQRLGIGPDANADEVRDASREYVNRLTAAGADAEAIAEVNAIKIDSRERREDYDAKHPPLTLLKVRPPSSELFERSDRRLIVLRRDLERALEDVGEHVYHPSDLTRVDFVRDFMASEMLDSTGRSVRRDSAR